MTNKAATALKMILLLLTTSFVSSFASFEVTRGQLFKMPIPRRTLAVRGGAVSTPSDDAKETKDLSARARVGSFLKLSDETLERIELFSYLTLWYAFNAGCVQSR